jgi:hypothetical protein
MNTLTAANNMAKLSIPLNTVERFDTRKSKGAGNGIFTDTLLFLCPKTARSLLRRVFIMVGVESEQFHLCTACQAGFTAHRPNFDTFSGGLSTLSKEVTQ